MQAREKIEGREGATEDSHGLSPACGFREEACTLAMILAASLVAFSITMGWMQSGR